jgi:hypothetical protein
MRTPGRTISHWRVGHVTTPEVPPVVTVAVVRLGAAARTLAEKLTIRAAAIMRRLIGTLSR